MNTIHISDLISTNNLKAFDIQYEASEIEREFEQVLIKSGTDLLEGHYEQYALQIGAIQAYVYIYHSTYDAIIGYQYDVFNSAGDEKADELIAKISEDFVKKISDESLSK